MSATQVYYSSFDAAFLKLPAHVRARIQRRIDEIGLRLATFPHHRLKGSSRFRARVGDYRIIYTFDLHENKFISLRLGIDEKSIDFSALGPRRFPRWHHLNTSTSSSE